MAKKNLNNRKYWEDREKAKLNKGIKDCNKLAKELEKQYKIAYKQIEKEINNIFEKYSKDNQLTYAEASKYLTGQEFSEWRKDIAGYMQELQENPEILLELETLSARSRITRWEEMLYEVDKILNNTTQTAEQQTTELLEDTYVENYNEEVFNISKQAGYVAKFSGVDQKTVKRTLSYPWSGSDYSSRLWNNKTKLRNTLKEEMTQMVIRGESSKKIASRVATRLDVNRKNAERLIRTEHAYVMNEASKKVYEELELEKYEFLATLDKRTCKDCGKLDGKIFNTKDAKAGFNYPPLHPNDRCTTVAHFEDDFLEDDTRFARDKNGKRIEVPANMTYDEWKKKYVDPDWKNDSSIDQDIKKEQDKKDKKKAKEEAKIKAAKEAKLKAEEEERKRKEAEEKARLEAERLEREKKEAEERAKIEEEKRKAAEEEKLKAQQEAEEAKKNAEEEATKKKAEEEAKKEAEAKAKKLEEENKKLKAAAKKKEPKKAKEKKKKLPTFKKDEAYKKWHLSDFNKIQKEWNDSVTEEEIDALVKYSGEEWYKLINKSLRGGKLTPREQTELDKINDKIDVISNALQRNKTTKDMKLYRGTSHSMFKDVLSEELLQKMKARKATVDELKTGLMGTIIKEKALCSTTTNFAVANNFYENVIVEIDVNRGSTGLANIAKWSEFQLESEVLMDKGTQFYIKDIDFDDERKIYYINVHYLGQE